jgi:hypothetical protein
MPISKLARSDVVVAWDSLAQYISPAGIDVRNDCSLQLIILDIIIVVYTNRHI